MGIGKNEQSTSTPWRGAQCSCIGLGLALACSLLMFATSHADAGWKACERIFRSLLFYCITITWQQIFKGSVTVVGVLPHVTVERRHLWQKMLRDSDC